MPKINFLKVNCQKQTLQKIIKLKTKKCCTFLELSDSEKKDVLEYINNKNLDIKIFGYKWFDILASKFYVDEYFIDKENIGLIGKNRKEFNDFDLFYNYINGDIYTDTCFYGYFFSNDEIFRYNIEKNKLNFDSFINKTIDDCSYDKLVAEKKENNKINLKKTKSMFKWLKQCELILSYNDLEDKYNKFIGKYNDYDDKYIFFSFVIQNQKNTIKKSLIDFFCKHNDFYDGLSFDDILLNYGKESALYVINNFGKKCCYNTKRNKINKFKKQLEIYECKGFKFLRNVSFDENNQLYIVRNNYYNNELNLCLNNKMYFFSFDDMVNYLNGDLQNANLLEAPINSKKILKYKVNENTIFPRSSNFFEYNIYKYFENDGFHVKQTWLDNNKKIILSHTENMKYFFDFVHFLKNDLSNADLLMSDGISNIKPINNIKLNNIKIKSQDALKLGINIVKESDNNIEKIMFDITKNNELETKKILDLNRIDFEEFDNNVSYVSDIHLSHKFNECNCVTQNDKEFVIRKITNTLIKESSMINIIAGDTSSDFETFKLFISELLLKHALNHYFFVLGNHELWGFKNKKYNEIIEIYKNLFSCSTQIHLVYNNIFYYMNDCWNEISQSELFDIESSELRKKLIGSKVILFGGIGYAGKNYEFNADAGLYEGTMLRVEEIKESNLFFSLYEKVTDALIGMNLIVVTHMPLKDWTEDTCGKNGVIYINGHTHKNYFYYNEHKRIYADNQIGYKNKNIKFKKFSVNLSFDLFINYKDGIYNISRNDYEKFYAGINEKITFTKEFKKLYMLKKEGVYMFLLQSTSGKLQILNGGSIKNVVDHDINYFYENINIYSKLLKNFLSKYNKIQKDLAYYVKKIGGNGKIHGCIIDIDYFNHIFLNPLDEKITPYYANSIIDKYVYENLPSLLKYECPNLFSNYEKMPNTDSNNLVIYKNKYQLVKNKTYVSNTEMYKISRIIKGLQFTSEYSIIRLWNDDFIKKYSEDNGREIVADIIEQKLKM